MNHGGEQACLNLWFTRWEAAKKREIPVHFSWDDKKKSLCIVPKRHSSLCTTYMEPFFRWGQQFGIRELPLTLHWLFQMFFYSLATCCFCLLWSFWLFLLSYMKKAATLWKIWFWAGMEVIFHMGPDRTLGIEQLAVSWEFQSERTE